MVKNGKQTHRHLERLREREGVKADLKSHHTSLFVTINDKT